MILRYAYSLDMPCSEDFTGSSGRDIVRIDGQPDRAKAVSAGKGKNQLAASGGISVPAKPLLHLISDVTGIAELCRGPDAQANDSNWIWIVDCSHFKFVSRDKPLDRIGWGCLRQNQFQIGIGEPAGVQECELFLRIEDRYSAHGQATRML
jgi:hypothetical protein